MNISCMEVINQLSTYVDHDVPSELREQISQHLAGCKHCSAVFDGMRNVIRLIADERSFELPVGFSVRLREKLSRELVQPS
jgi:anti-sigma factor (TIGR02949 family)